MKKLLYIWFAAPYTPFFYLDWLDMTAAEFTFFSLGVLCYTTWAILVIYLYHANKVQRNKEKA